MKKSNVVGVALVATVCGFVTINQANAQTGFGTIPGASGNPYSGSGIPFNTSEYSQISAGWDTLTLAMAATQHGSVNPAPGNNGAGTYTVNPGLVLDPVHLRSTWNFDFYVNSSQGVLSDYTFALVETANGHTFSFNPGLIPDNVPHLSPSTMGNSESLDFASFGAPIAYNPNANDTYHFELDAFLNGNEIGSDRITVIAGTGAAPDGGSTLFLLGFGLAGLALLAFRQNRIQDVK